MRKILSQKWVLILWICVCILLGVQLIRSALTTKNAFFAKSQAEERLKKEEETGFSLMEQLRNAQSPLEKEKRIRDQLNMQKPGEIILSIPSPSPKP